MTSSNDFLTWLTPTTTTTVRGSLPSLAKARQYGTNGKLGVNGPIGNTASEYTARISRSSEAQYMQAADAADRSLLRLQERLGFKF